MVAPIPMMRDVGALSPDTLRAIALLHPPLVWQTCDDERRFVVIGNLRTAELCKQRLPADDVIPVICLRRRPEQYSVATLLRTSYVLSSVTYGLDALYAATTLNRAIESIPEEVLAGLADGMETKLGRERLLGINRRYQIPEREFKSAPTSQMSLMPGGIDD